MSAGSGPSSPVLEPVYDVDDRPPLSRAVPLGLQHVLVMFTGNVTIPLILAGAIGAPDDVRALLVQMALFIGGVATLVQTLGIGPVGARLPVVMGTSIGFVAIGIPIANAFGIAAVFGGALIAGVIQGLIGVSLRWLRWLFPPLVTGIVVIVIGASVIPAGINFAAGGVAAEDFGAPSNFLLAGLVLLIIVGVSQYTRGFFSLIAIFVGVVVGYLVAIPLGFVDFDQVTAADWFAVPRPFTLGISFPAAAVIGMALMAVATAVETIGDLTAITKTGAGRDITDRQLTGGLLGDGIGTSLSALFSAMPNTSYSQNVGVVAFTGVMSRYVVSIGGVFLLIAGLFPKLGAVVAVMPPPVLGGAAIAMFGMVTAAGIQILSEAPFTRRNMLIIALSLATGIGVLIVPDAVAELPEQLRVLLETGLFQATLVAIVLNVVLPGRTLKVDVR